MRRTPTVWQVRWARWHRLVVIVLAVAVVLTAVFVSLGVAALLFVLMIGLGAFGSGVPSENGKNAAPSIARLWGGRW